MKLVFSRIKEIIKRFNLHEFTFDDVERIAARERIRIVSYLMPEQVRGYYVSERRKVYRKKFIVLNERLPEFERLYVALHELAHHFLHVSLPARQTFYCRAGRLVESKQDAEADAIALILLIPQKKLLELAETPFEDLHPYTQELLVRRQRLYEQFDV